VFILANGIEVSGMVEANKYGKMEVFMMVNGKIIWQMEKVD